MKPRYNHDNCVVKRFTAVNLTLTVNNKNDEVNVPPELNPTNHTNIIKFYSHRV